MRQLLAMNYVCYPSTFCHFNKMTKWNRYTYFSEQIYCIPPKRYTAPTKSVYLL